MIPSYCSANQTSRCCTFNGGGCDLCEVDKQKLVIQNSHALLCNLVPSPCIVCWFPVYEMYWYPVCVIHMFPVGVIHLFPVCVHVIPWFTVSVIHLFPIFAILCNTLVPSQLIHWFTDNALYWFPVCIEMICVL